MKTVFKVMLGVTFALLLVAGGCAALVGGAVSEVEKDNQRSAITRAQFDAIQTGQTLDAVTEALQPAVPSDEQTTEVDTGDSGIDADSTCIYYNKEKVAEGLYQFCFDGAGKLTSKGAY